MQKTSCIVHKPFSANQMYVPIARGKMVKSRKYNTWIEKNLPVLTEEMLPASQFPINVELLVMANHLWRMKNDSDNFCLLYTSPSPRDGLLSRMPSSA